MSANNRIDLGVGAAGEEDAETDDEEVTDRDFDRLADAAGGATVTPGAGAEPAAEEQQPPAEDQTAAQRLGERAGEVAAPLQTAEGGAGPQPTRGAGAAADADAPPPGADRPGPGTQLETPGGEALTREEASQRATVGRAQQIEAQEPGPAADLEEEQVDAALASIETSIEEQTGIDVTVTRDDVIFRRGPQGVRIQLTRSFVEGLREQTAARQLSARFETDVGVEDVEATREIQGGQSVPTLDVETGRPVFGVTPRIQLSPETQAAISEELIQERLREIGPEEIQRRVDERVDRLAGQDLQAGVDYRINRTDRGIEVELTDIGRTKVDAGEELEERLVFRPLEPTGEVAGRQTVTGEAPIFVEEDGEIVQVTTPDLLTSLERSTLSFAENFGERVEVGLLTITGSETVAGAGGQFAEGIGETATIPFRPREIAETGEAIVEFTAEQATDIGGELAEGDIEGAAVETRQAAGQTLDVATDVGQTIIENPFRTAGGAFISGGLLSLPGRAGTVARGVYQPFEEVATAGLTRAAPGVASRLPGGRIDVEEPIIAGVVRGGRGLRRGARGTRRILLGEAEFRPTLRQRQLIELGRPGAARVTIRPGVEGERGVVGARSEPLGAPTEGALEAATSIEPARAGRAEPTTEAEAEAEAGPPAQRARPAEPPLFGEIRAAGGVRPFIRGEDLPQRIPEEAIPENLRRFLGEERAQAGLAAARRRQVEQETEPEIDIETVREFEDVQRELLEQRRQLGGEFEGEFDPVGAGARRRGELATEPTVETRTEAEAERPRAAETQLPGERTRLAARPRQRARQQPIPGLGFDVRTGARSLETEVQRPVAEVRLTGEQEAEQELAIDVEAEARREQAAEVAPPFEQEQRRRRDRDEEREVDADEQALAGIVGLAQPILTDFVNPVTGEVIETERGGQ